MGFQDAQSALPDSSDWPECASCSPNTPRTPWPNQMGQAGACTTRTKVGYSGGTVSADVTTSECISLPLKSGRSLIFKWNRLSGMGVPSGMHGSATSYYNWSPSGESSLFSFLPQCYAEVNSDPSTNMAFVHTEEGNYTHDVQELVAGYLPVTQTWDATYFTQIFLVPGVYYEYFTDSPDFGPGPMNGRLNRIYDRNGNELFYSWYLDSNNLALLDRITGSDLAGNVIPYFIYPGNTQQPITQIYLYDTVAPHNSRSIYFEYIYVPDDTTDPVNTNTYAILSKTINPNGCAREYDMRYPYDTNTAANYYVLKREVDAGGYQTYFEYAITQYIILLTKTVEPEGRITYYDYHAFNDNRKAYLGRKRSYFEIGYIGDLSVPAMQTETDPLGNVTYYIYIDPDPAIGVGGIIRYNLVIEPNGNQTYYNYNYEIDASTGFPLYNLALLATTSVFNGAQTYFQYGAPISYDVTSMTGPRRVAGSYDVTTYYTYDGNRNRTATIDALGNSTKYGRDGVGRVAALMDPRGGVTYFNYSQTIGSLDSQVDAVGNVAYFTYDSFLNALAKVSPRWPEQGFAPFTTYYVYDLLDRRIQTTDRQGNVTYFDWTSRGDLLDTVDARGTTVAFTYDGMRRKTQSTVTNSSGTQLAQSRNGYDIYNNLTAAQDPLGHTTYYFYDAIDRLTAKKDAVLASTYYYYDQVNNLAATRDARGNFTYFFYDPLSRQVARRDAQLNVTYFGYDLADNRTQSLDARLNPTYFFYDKLDRIQAIRDALSNPTYFYFDSAGNSSVVVNARFNSTYFGYDPRNLRTTIQDALGNVTYFAFDGARNLTRTLDALQNATSIVYDTLDRPQSRVDAVGNATYFFYDSIGNRTLVRDARGNAAYFTYDGLRRTTASQDALGDVSYFFYDLASNRIGCGIQISTAPTSGYDAINRLTRIQDALGGTTYYEYDSVSNLTKVLDPDIHAVLSALTA